MLQPSNNLFIDSNLRDGVIQKNNKSLSEELLEVQFKINSEQLVSGWRFQLKETPETDQFFLGLNKVNFQIRKFTLLIIFSNEYHVPSKFDFFWRSWNETLHNSFISNKIQDFGIDLVKSKDKNNKNFCGINFRLILYEMKFNFF